MSHRLLGKWVGLNGIVSATCLIVWGSIAAASDWPQWRGPDRNGVAEGGPILARAWPVGGLANLWNSEGIPGNEDMYGWATPVVANGRVHLFVPQDIGGQWRDVFYCLNVTNGATLWKKDFPSAGPFEGGSSGICVDSGRLYVAGNNRALYCLSAANGDIVWQVDGRRWWPANSTGPHSSFLVVDGVAVIQTGSHDGPGCITNGLVVALDKETGAVRWISPPKFGGQGSPVPWRKDGRTFVLVYARDGLSCYDLATGDVRWRAMPGGSSHTPVVSGDYAVCLTDNSENRLTCFRMFTNRAEVAWQSASMDCFDPGASAAIRNGYVYAAGWNSGENGWWASDQCTALCVQLGTGAIAWRAKVPCGGYSSPLIVDGKFYVPLNGGQDLLMVDATPDAYRPLGQATVGGEFYISPVIAGGRLVVRTSGRIACYDLTDHGNHAPTIQTNAAAVPNPVALPNAARVSVAALDQDNDLLMYTWSKVSGPGDVAFSPNGAWTSAVSTASFSAAGTYGLRVTANDGRGGSVTGVLTVTVNPAVIPGIVAGVAGLSVPENGTATFQVQLAAPPAGDVTVTVARASGDADISVLSGGNLVFAPSNWAIPQPVTLAAAPDADASNGVAIVACSAPGLTGVAVVATEDDAQTALTVTSAYVYGGTTAPTGTVIVTKGAAATIAATPKTGYVFSRWNVTDGVAAIADPTAATTTVAIASPAGVQAYFAVKSLDIRLSNYAGTLYNVPEGGTLSFGVKLTGPPTGDTTVTVARASGDADISVLSGDSLLFATTNWDIPQTVTLIAAPDADATNGAATIAFSFGLTNKTRKAIESDRDTILSVTATAGGVATPGGAAIVTRNWATAVAATPSPGYAFVNWTVTSGVARIADTNAANTTVTIAEPAAIRANFAAIIAPLGTPGWWLAQYGFTNDFAAAELLDSDSDGMRNWEEYVAGTRPNDKNSYLAMTQLGSCGTNAVEVRWTSEADHYYDLWRSTNLVQGFNARIGTNLPATPPMNVHTDKTANCGTLFYRIEAK